MAVQNLRWIENLNRPSQVGPFLSWGLFAAGASQAITPGQILERTGNTNTEWVPIDSDHDATVTKLAIAAEELLSGDLAGYYQIVVPLPGDVFEFDLAAASAMAPETALYYSSATALATSGTNILAYSYFGPNFPGQQYHMSKGQLGDQGTTFRSTNRVRCIFRAAVSIYSLWQRA